MIWLAVAGPVVGYLIGRLRPWKTLRDRAWWWAMCPKPGRLAKPKIVIALVVQADLLAVASWRHWKRRNDPPPEPIRVNPKFLRRTSREDQP